MDYCKKDVTPLVTHWSHIFLAIYYRDILGALHQTGISCQNIIKSQNVLHNSIYHRWFVWDRPHLVLPHEQHSQHCWHGIAGDIFSCDQAALWMVFSVRLSVCPSVPLSVCPSVTPFWLCSHHCIIMKFSGVITLDQGKVHAKGQGQRSKVKVTEVTTQIFVSGL